MLARRTAVALGVFAFAVVTSIPAGAVNKCAGTKIKLAGKKASCLLGLESKSEAKNAPKDSTKVAKCKSSMSSAFAKNEAKGGCSTTGDYAAIEDKVDAFVDDLAGELSKVPPNKCNASKLKLAGKKNACLLGLESKLLAKGTPLDTTKVAKCHSSMSSAFAKNEAKGGCSTTGDYAAIEAKVDAHVADLSCELGAGATCSCGTPDPHVYQFRQLVGSGTCGAVLDDTGATDLNLDCVKLYTGGGSAGTPPTEQPDNGTSKFNACCSGKTLYLRPKSSSETGSNRNCTDVGCLFAPPLPIENPTQALSTCVINKVAVGGRGTATCDAGSASIGLPLGADVFLTGDVLPKRCTGTLTDPNDSGRKCAMDSDCPGGMCADDSATTQPCAICNASTNRCNGGPNDGVACTPGTLNSSGPHFPTSHDCPSGGFFLATLPIPFGLTTGTSSKTATDMGTQANVFCGFCGNVSTATWRNPATSCTADPDCTSLTTGCGNTTCIGGPNAGAVCTKNPQCTPGTCNGPGTLPCSKCKQRTGGAFKAGTGRTVTETGTPAGALVTNGSPAPETLVSVFCIPPICQGVAPCGITAVDAASDIPGPGATSLPEEVQLLP